MECSGHNHVVDGPLRVGGQRCDAHLHRPERRARARWHEKSAVRAAAFNARRVDGLRTLPENHDDFFRLRGHGIIADLSREEILHAIAEDLRVELTGQRTTLLLRALQNQFAAQAMAKQLEMDAIERGEPPVNPTRIVRASVGSDNAPPPSAASGR